MAGRRPVLLYGDSFANHRRSLNPFFHKRKALRQYFNADSTLARHCYMLNYGVGGYGLDQIHLLYKKSIGSFRNPFVVYSFLLDDINRALLSVRLGQKPIYVVDVGHLVLTGLPIEKNIDDFYDHHPLRIGSYLYRMFIYGKFLPPKIALWLQGNDQIVQRETLLTRLLLREAVETARVSRTSILFLIFTEQWSFSFPDWHQAMVEKIFAEDGAEYISAQQLVANDIASSGRALREYYLADGHPSDLQYQVLFKALRRRLLAQCK